MSLASRKVITMTTSHRPQYLRQVLEALSQCEGIEEYLILACAEPGNDEVRALLEGISFAERQVTAHSHRLGCSKNTHFALVSGFELTDFVIHIEDDTVPARDTLRFFEHCCDAYRNDSTIFTVGGYPSAPDAERVSADRLGDRYRTLRRHQWFTPWGWATWKNRFEEMRHNWGEDFDIHLNFAVRGERFEITPILSRFQNIGAERGTHVPNAQWHRENQHLECWAGVVDVPQKCAWHEPARRERSTNGWLKAALSESTSAIKKPVAPPNLTLENASDLAGQVLENVAPYPSGRFSGRGIVICAGGVKYLTCAWVLIRLLRRLGCQLPIEVWYLGEDEKDLNWIELVAPYGAVCVDAHEVRNRHPHPSLGGWESKAYAILHCRFREVMLLDADNVPTIDPTFLFDTREYLSTGAIFWPDTPSMNSEHPAWQVFGVPYRDEREQESGQIVIDKQRCWSPLNLCNWYNEHSDFFYRFVYGDKDTFRFAWHRAGQPVAMVPIPHQPLPLGVYQFDFSGKRLFQHRIHDKWSLAGNAVIPDFIHERTCKALVDELRDHWNPVVGKVKHLSSEDRAQMARVAEHLSYQFIVVGRRHWPIRLSPDGRVIGAGPLERYWWCHGDRLLFSTLDGRGLTTLTELSNGSWRGRTMHYGGVEVRLVKTRRGPNQLHPAARDAGPEKPFQVLNSFADDPAN